MKTLSRFLALATLSLLAATSAFANATQVFGVAASYTGSGTPISWSYNYTTGFTPKQIWISNNPGGPWTHWIVTDGAGSGTAMYNGTIGSALAAAGYAADGTYYVCAGNTMGPTRETNPVQSFTYVASATTPLTAVVFNNLTYNGSAQTTTVASVTPAGATYSTSGLTQTNAGTYTGTLTGTGSYSGTVTASWTMNKATAAVPSISPPSQSITTGSNATITASGGSTGTFQWTGAGSGGGSSDTINFPTAGSYNVYVFDPGDANYNASGLSAASVVNVSAPLIPITGVTFNSYTYTGSTITTTVASVSPAGATYTSGGGTWSGINASTYSATISGTGGYSGNATNSWAILPTDQAITVSPSSPTVAAGGSVTFTASGGHNSYSWGGSASGWGASQSVTFSTPGTYTVTVQNIAGGNYNASNVATSTITVTDIGTTFVFGNLTQTYDGSIKTATVTPTPADATYSSSLSSSSPAAGSYPVSATANGSFSGNGSATLVIQPASQTITLTPLSSTVNAGDSVTFTAAGGQNAYVWGGSASGSGASQTVTFSTPGSYTVTVQNVAGGNYTASNTVTANITVNAVVTTFTFGNLTQTYDGSIKTATVTPNPAGATFTSSLTGGPNANTYPVTATATGAYSGSGSANLVIQPANQTVTLSPASSTIATNGTVTLNAAGGNTSYTWGGSASGSGASQLLTFPTNGTYTVTVRDAGNGNYNASNTATATILVEPPLSISQSVTSLSLIFPGDTITLNAQVTSIIGNVANYKWHLVTPTTTTPDVVVNGPSPTLTGSAPFSVTDLGAYSFVVTAVDSLGNTLTGTYNFTVVQGLFTRTLELRAEPGPGQSIWFSTSPTTSQAIPVWKARH